MKKYKENIISKKKKSFTLFLIALIIGMLGFSYASVPLYRLFCQVTGYGGTTQTIEKMSSNVVKSDKSDRIFTIHFNADVSDSLP